MNDKPPKDMHADSQVRELKITWAPDHVGHYPCRSLRLACHCAGCVDEMTSERIVDPATIPEDILIKEMHLVGNYAVKIVWSDGHDTGLYTWKRLAQLCPCPECEPKSATDRDAPGP